MGKLVFFLLFLIVIIYPIYEVKNQKVNHNRAKKVKIHNLIIDKGKFFIYETNLSKDGNFDRLIKDKNKYTFFNLTFLDLVKKEEIISQKTIYNFKKVFFKTFFYKNKDYNFTSNIAVYLLNNKIFKGNNFMLIGKNYKGKGSYFIIDKNRNLKADNIIFDIKEK